MKRSHTPTRLYITVLALTFVFVVAACQPAPNPAADPNNTQAPAPKPNGQATALIPATLAPTPTQFQPELTSQAATQVPLGIKQLAGTLAILPSHYEWTQQSGATQAPDGVVQFSIQVSLENTSATEAVSFDPAQFSLLDSTGQALAISSAVTNPQPLTAQTLNPGVKVQGALLYEVPESEQTETGWSVRLVFAGPDGQSFSWSLAG